MKQIFTYFSIILLLSGCKTAADSKIDPGLAEQIRQDNRIVQVKAMAEELMKEGLNAGDSYSEIWIRDLNTFIELACKSGDINKIRESLLTFFKLQGKDGNIVDGYVKRTDAGVSYNYYYSDLAPEFSAHKNTVETDQEASLIQAVAKFIDATGDTSIMKENIGGKTADQRMADALNFLMEERMAQEYGLLWGATTVDWGDVQPEHEWGVNLDDSSHLCIDIYDNAMFIIAINDYLRITQNDDKEHWVSVRDQIAVNIRKYLWDEGNQKFIPHIYLNGSPFPADFDENAIYYHGGTAIAIEAGLLSNEEILVSYQKMKENVNAANAQSIGLTLYPVYPNGFFKNKGMGEYSYQNGGDWTWFGGRMVQQLIANGFYGEAYEAISPMLDRSIKHNNFYEWWTPDGTPNNGNFRGSAGVLWKAIRMFEEVVERPTSNL